MRLLIVSNLFHPDHAGGAAIYTDFALAMAERGHDVTVRCAYSYFPEWRDKSGRNGWRVSRENLDGVHVERFGLVLPREPRRLSRRLLFEGSHLASLSRSLPNGSFDAALVFATHPSSTAFGALVASLRRVPLWINVQDLASDAARATGVAGRGRTERVLEGLDRLMLGRADVLSGISPGMVDRLRELCPTTKVAYLPNWLHRSMAGHIAGSATQGRPPVGGGPIRLLYAGNVGGKQDLLRLCQVLAPSDAPFQLRIHAAGSGFPALRDWVAGTPDPRFEVHPVVPEQQFVDALRRCHLFVISETPGSGHSYAPSKLLPALATGTPVLGVSDADSSIGEELRAHDIGIAADWDSVANLPDRLTALVSDPTDLDRWSVNASARATSFDRAAVLDELASGLEALAARQ